MKKNNLFKILLVGCAICFSAGPALAAVGQVLGKAVDSGVAFTDQQKVIIVKKSQPAFTIILPANHTTGYSWALKSFDNVLIKPIGRKYTQTNPGLIGGGGYEKWTFQVNSEGFIVPQTTNITLIYARPWEMEQGIQVKSFKVVTGNDS
jgi:predicted secreted protein